MVVQLGSVLHDEWRASRKIADTDRYEPRVKKTKDQNWIDAHGGAVEVDIANMPYSELPSDWQYENHASAQVTVDQVADAVSGGTELNAGFVETASAVLHEEWLKRNGAWAPAEQKLPYAELSEAEKEKDRVIIRKGIELYKKLSQPAEQPKAVSGIVADVKQKVEAVQPITGLDERNARELKRVLGYTLTVVDAGDKVEVEVSRIKTDKYDTKPELAAKGVLPKTDDLRKMIERLAYNINNFGEGYGMPEAETRKMLNGLAEKLQQ